MLLSKRAAMYLPQGWPAYFDRIHRWVKLGTTYDLVVTPGRLQKVDLVQPLPHNQAIHIRVGWFT
jgi:hypothetical protein